MKQLFLCLFTIAVWQQVQADLSVISPSELRGTYQAASIFLPGVERNYLPITGQLTLNTDTNKTDKIVLVTVTLPMEPLYRSLQAAGAVGILASSVGEPGYLMYTLDGSNTSNITIPISQMKANDYNTLQSHLSDGTFPIIIATLSVGHNMWIDVNSSNWMIVWQVAIGSYSVIIVILSVHRLVSFILASKLWSSYLLSKIVLSIIAIANLERIVFAIVDPLSIRQMLNFITSRALLTASFPISMIASVLILFYWNEQMSFVNVKVRSFISKLKIPAAIVIALLIAFELTSDLLRALTTISYTTTMIVVSSYLLLSLPLGIFYFVTALKVIRVTKKIGKHSKKNQNLRKLTFKLLAAGLIQAFVVIPNVLLIFLLTASPISLYLLFLVVIFAFDTIDLLEILSFRLPKNKTPVSSTEKSQKPSQMNSPRETSSEMKNLESPTT